MAEIAGYGGKVIWTGIASDVSYNVRAWALDVVVDPLEVTTFADSGNRTYIRGLKGWSGTVDLYTDDTKQTDVADVGTSAAISLYLNGTHYYSGTALCTGFHPATNVDGVVEGSLDFTGSGLLSYT